MPLIIAGSAILMALLERFRVLVWAGGALLGWVAGDIMSKRPGGRDLARRARSDCTLGGRIGALIVVARAVDRATARP